MKKRSEFLRPRLSGERFDRHAIPVEVLKDWAAFEDLIIETAKWLYLRDNSTRSRVPRGFSKDFSLQLTAVVEGSAIPVLEREALMNMDGEAGSDWFDYARDQVIAVIAAASRGESVQGILPTNLLGYFDRFGRNLRDDERIDFQSRSGDYNVSYTREVRKTLILSHGTEYKSEEHLRGKVSEVNAKKKTFTFEPTSGGLVACSYQAEVAAAIIDSLKVFESDHVRITGLTVRNGTDQLLRVEDVAHVELLDPLDVPSRLEELAQLKDGWMDGDGIAPPKEGLVWLGKKWDEHWVEDLRLPYVYPMLDGGIQAEWTLGEVETSLSIDLRGKTATWITSEDELDGDEVLLDLSEADGWRRLVELVRSISAAQGLNNV